MNLRDIKKDIDYVLSAFIEDCTVCAAVNPKSDDKVIADLMEDAIDLYNELRDKVTVKIEGSKKAYFNNLRKEILERTDALYTKLSEAVSKKAAKAEEAPKAEKPAAKKAEPKAEKKAPAKKAEPKAEEAPKAEKKAPAKKAPAKKAEPKAEKPAAEKKPAAKKPAAKKAAPKAE
jgi:hypothetical protein